MAAFALAAPVPCEAAFRVQYMAAGRRENLPLASAWSNRFEDARPIRHLMSVKGQANFSGLYYAATTGRHVGFESWLERDVLMELDFDRAVTGFSSQPFQLTWQQDGRPRRHIPDYFARSDDGTGIVIDVRPDDRIEARDAEAFSATEAACREVGWEFRRVAGPAAVFAANLRWLAGYRHPRCMDDRRAAALLAELGEPAPLFRAAGATGDLAAVLPVAYHLLWRQVLRADLRSSLLGPEVNVWAAAGDVQ